MLIVIISISRKKIILTTFSGGHIIDTCFPISLIPVRLSYTVVQVSTKCGF